MAFYKGLYGNTPVVIVRSGIGKVNAAICTQILVDRYHITAVINTGIAGGLYHKIHIGDIVIATEALQHDMDARGFGYKLGKYLRWIHRFLMLIQYCGRWRQRYADGLIRIFRYMKAELSVATALFPDSDKKEMLWQEFQGYCTEMEGAAIAQAAYLNRIPYLIIRAISDQADGKASVDYSTFESKAAEHSVNLVDALLQEI